MKIIFYIVLASSILGIHSLAISQAPNAEYSYSYPYHNGIPFTRFKERRQTILQKHSPKCMIVSLSADIRNRQNDVNYEYRQNSNFFYLTGMPDAQAALILSPGGIPHQGNLTKEIFFVLPRNMKKEVWEGTTMGIQEAGMLGIETVMDITKLKDVIIENLQGIDTIFFTGLPTQQVRVPLVEKPIAIETELRNELQKKFPDLYVKTILPDLPIMREIKDDDELRMIKQAIDISMEGHKAAMKFAKPGITEYELEAMMEFTFKKLGAEEVGYASIMGASYNACILHYTKNRKQTSDGDLILADCGAEYQNYTADITRTFPVNGKFTKEQKIIYDFVLEAADSAIKECVVGKIFRAPHNAAKAVLIRRLKEIGLIENDEQISWYFMHGTSHYLGLDVHDAGSGGLLKHNSVITVEPGIYIPQGSPCDKKWWNTGIRIEDDILITNQGPINLSEALPRTTSEIETLMKSDSK